MANDMAKLLLLFFCISLLSMCKVNTIASDRCFDCVDAQATSHRAVYVRQPQPVVSLKI